MTDRDRTVLTAIRHGLAIEAREHVAIGVIGEAMGARLGWCVRVVGCGDRIGITANIRLRGNAARTFVTHHLIKRRVCPVERA